MSPHPVAIAGGINRKLSLKITDICVAGLLSLAAGSPALADTTVKVTIWDKPAIAVVVTVPKAAVLGVTTNAVGKSSLGGARVVARIVITLDRFRGGGVLHRDGLKVDRAGRDDSDGAPHDPSSDPAAARARIVRPPRAASKSMELRMVDILLSAAMIGRDDALIRQPLLAAG